MEKYISTSLSPMAEAGKLIKKYDPDCKVVFIGPCTAKKGEIKDPKVAEYIDYVLTFEELQALIDSKDIEVEELPETDLNTASPFGRNFARSGGVADAVAEAVKERIGDEVKVNPIVCDGIDQCKSALTRASRGVLPNNFIEGMVCDGGCIGGAACLTHVDKANRKKIEAYGISAKIKEIQEAVEQANNRE